MALKRQSQMLDTFSMSSMTDVIFLLLVFFMVTSTFVFPTALDINLPQGTEQQPLKPSTRVYVDAEGNLYVSWNESEPMPVVADSLTYTLRGIQQVDSAMTVAVYADAEVPYGRVVEVLNAGADISVKMVLATNPTQRKLPDSQQIALDEPFAQENAKP